jgi:D-glycero-alpha-D-manno-heptose-7-phosphate kinase
VLNAAINLRAEVTIYTENDVFKISKNVIPHLGSLDFMHKTFTHFNIGNFHHVRFRSTSEALLESGLGTSAASAVATVGAINKALNLGLDKTEIALKAWAIELNDIGLFGGKQDQIASSIGGVNVIEFTKGGTNIQLQPLTAKFITPLLPYIVLFYTGSNRKSAKIQEGLKHLSKYQIESLDRIKELAASGTKALASGDMELVGRLLNESWTMKKKSNKGVSSKKIDKIYNTAIDKGAWGGKIMGAGGGGHMFFICPPEKREELVTTLEKIDEVEEVDFGICWNGLEVRRLDSLP